MSTRPIRGRAAELTVISSLVAELAQGSGGVLVVEGPPGIGKSRLMTESRVLAEKAGARTLFGQCFEYQRTVPFFSLFTATLHAVPTGRRRGSATPAGCFGRPRLLGGGRAPARN